MRLASHSSSGNGLPVSESSPGRPYRGSRKRLQRLRWQTQTPLSVWILIGCLLLILLVVVLRA